MIATRFAGIHNVVNARDMSVPAYSDSQIEYWMQDAVDVDITDAGGFIARTGYTQSLAVSISAAHSTFEGINYIVSSGTLYEVGPQLSLYARAACTATEFTDYSNTLFTSDGLRVMGESVTNLNVPVPDAPGIILSGGARPAGRYNVVTTYANADGLEGGTSEVATVVLDTEGDFLVVPASLPGHTTNIYVTDCNGSVFFNTATRARLIPAQLNANPFPNTVDKIEYHEGRLYIAVQENDYTIVWFSDPVLFHLFGADDGYFVVPGAILDMRSTPQGLVIGTDKELYVYQDSTLSILASYGVVPGRSMVKLPDRSLLIHTVRGVCKALPFQPITAQKVSLAMGTKCNTNIVYSRGIMKYVGIHDGGTTAFNRY